MGVNDLAWPDRVQILELVGPGPEVITIEEDAEVRMRCLAVEPQGSGQRGQNVELRTNSGSRFQVELTGDLSNLANVLEALP